MQSMAGGGSSGGDISQTAAYRNMVSQQAERIEERRNKGKKGRQAAAAPAVAGVGGGAGAGGGAAAAAASTEQAHALAREMAPTYSHSLPEEVELGGQVFGLVGDALRTRFGRGGGGGAAAKREGKEATPDSKKAKKGKKKGKKGDRTPSPGGSQRAAPAPASSVGGGGGSSSGGGGSSSGSGGSSSGGGSALAADLDRIIQEVVGVLAGHDPRCALPVFSQQVMLINQRLGKGSDPNQIAALFAATQVNGYVDFVDWLRRDSTRAYFTMGESAQYTA